MTTFFKNKQHYLTFKKAWALAAQSKNLTAEHHLLYNILRGMPANKGFKPITNTNKLENGMYPNWGLFNASGHLDWMCSKARRLIADSYDGYGSERSRRAIKAHDRHSIYYFTDIIIQHLPDNYHAEGKKKVDDNFTWFVNILATLVLPSISPYDSEEPIEQEAA